MHCINCGANLPEGAKFCMECGTAVSQPSKPGQGAGVKVDQHVQTNEGQVVGLSAGKGALPGGFNADIKQDIGVVKDNGAVVGVIQGGEAPIHVGGQQSYVEKTEVDTGGGAFVGGGVTISGDGSFVGRDKVVHGDEISVGDVSGEGIAIGSHAQATVNKGISGSELAALFAPIVQAAQSAPPEKREQAVQNAEQLQAEIGKGKQANDTTVAGLIEGLVGLVPGAISAVVTAFGSPVLAGIAGPATNYVLGKLGLKK